MHSKFTIDFDVIIYLYIDDMLIFSTNMIGIVEIKRYLTSIFKMKDLSEVDTILCIKVNK
jgi:protein associated with RNAse G/E